MRQFDICIAFEESVVNLVGQIKGVCQTILTGGTLTGNNRTNFGASTAGLQTVLFYKRTQIVDLVVRYALNFDGQTGGHCNFAITKALCSFGDALAFFCSDLTIAGNDASIEVVSSLIVQEAPCFYSLDVLCTYGNLSALFWHNVDSQTAFENLCIGIAKEAQTVLQEVCTFTLVADQQQFFLFAQSFYFAGNGVKINIWCTGNAWHQSSVYNTVALCLALHEFCRCHAVHLAFQFILQHVDCSYKWMDCSRKWRCISHIHVLQLIDGCTHSQSNNTDIGNLVHSTGAQYLNTQQFAAVLICNQLDDKHTCTWVIVCFVICCDHSRDHIIASFVCSFFTQTGAAAVKFWQFYNSGTQNARIAAIFSTHCLCQSSAFHICGGTHWRPCTLAGQTVGYADTVTCCIYVWQIGFHLAVYQNGSVWHHFQTSIF